MSSEHVWLTTQPLEIVAEARTGDAVAGLDRVAIASWSIRPTIRIGTPTKSHYVASRLPESWHRRVFFENALEFYGWTEADLPAPAAMAVT